MKTQISRDSFRPAAGISGVYLQQGRMIVDADWNEAIDVGRTRLVSALRDAIGSGAPRTGGLAIVKPAGEVLIESGALYVDGVPAFLVAPATGLALGAQPDYRHAPALPSAGTAFNLYADVWERAFTGLEDTHLLDAGLHGSDTATRTRTLLQVKWCDASIDPHDTTKNPAIGNAKLRLKLRQIVTERDCCDPCAVEVEVDERIGNALFRCEVHDVIDDGTTREVVLKWSRDNGAEAYAPTSYPQGFDQGDWIWEFFDSDTENLLGHHFPPSEARRRGLLSRTFDVPAGGPGAFVRQWDGFARIKLAGGAWTLADGRDRNADLSTTSSADAHAFVRFDGDGLHANLDLVELHLLLDGTFVAGDYWQATVREATQESGDWILGETDGVPPQGVHHHYLHLASVDAAGALVPQDDDDRRRMHFPPLTDVWAADVAFVPKCTGLYGDAKNVQAALDALCGIGAEDIAYTLPECGMAAGSAPTVRSLMATVPNFPNLDGVDPAPSVKDLLDALMCHLDATRVPLDKSTLTCNDLSNPAVVTVQDALDALCKRPGGGCEISVPVGELERLLREFANSADRLDLSLCLLPGEHVLGAPLDIVRKHSIRIHGLSPDSSILVLKGHSLSISADNIAFDRVHVLGENACQLKLAGKRLTATGCTFHRSAGGPSATPLVLVRLSDQTSQLTWRDNQAFATWTKRSWLGDRLVRADVITHRPLKKALTDLFDLDQVRDDPRPFEEAMANVVGVIGAMPPDERKALATTFETEIAKAHERIQPPPPGTVAKRTARKTVAKAAKATKATKASKVAKTTKVAKKSSANLAANTVASAGARLDLTIAARIDRRSEVLNERFGHDFSTVVSPGIADASIRTELESVRPENNRLRDVLIRDIVLWAYEVGDDPALAIETNTGNCFLADNVLGEVLLMNGLKLGTDGMDPDPSIEIVTGLTIDSSGSFTARGNRMQRLWCLVPTTAGEGLPTKVNGWRTAIVEGNAFVDVRSSIVAWSLNMTANHFEVAIPESAALMRIFTERLVASSNSSHMNLGDLTVVRYYANGPHGAELGLNQVLFVRFWSPI